METNKIVSAQFDLLPVFVTLTVNTSGPGNGTVTSVPAGIVCEPVCAFSYLAGTTVRLTATASGGSVFAGWRGAICDAFGNAPCDITMNDNITVNARFEAGGGGG
jgi:hypothetical protein